MRHHLYVFASLLLLTACQPAPGSTNLAPISFADKAPIRLGVGTVEVIENYRAPGVRPNVEQEFAVSPAQTVRAWANERLRAMGGPGRMEVIIEDASVRETPLNVKKGVTGFFTDDQSARYDGAVKVSLRLYDGESAIAKAEGDVAVSRSQTLNEKASVNDRERLWHDITRDMAVAFDKEAELRLRQYFTPYLR